MRSTGKKRIFEIIQIGYDKDVVSRGFDVVIILMILANLFIALFETFEASTAFLPVLNTLELVTVVFFTVEYCLRLWTADLLFPGKPLAKALLCYVFSFSGVIDLCSFLFYYLPFVFPSGVVAFRMFRIVRILRLFRINAYYDALNVISDVVKSKKDQLLSSIFIILVLMMAASLCMYSLEHSVQPEIFQNAFSGFWWAVSTLLTVGYGDIYPITFAGRLFGICITFLGVGMVAIPTGILSAGFVEQYARLKTLEESAGEGVLPCLSLAITEAHPWADCTVEVLPLPPGLQLTMVVRLGQPLLPQGGTRLQVGDCLLLCAEGQGGTATLQELTLGGDHPWIGRRMEEVELSRLTVPMLVRRGEEALPPEDRLTLQQGDRVLLYRRRRGD